MVNARLLLPPFVLALFILAAHAQNPAPADPIPPDGQPWRIERVADIPPPLASALAKTNCRQGEATLATFPIEIFRPAAGASAVAIVPCVGIVLYGRAFLFERDLASEPRPIVFPVMAIAGTVTASETPGVMSWSPQTRTLVALQGNDVCDGVIARHSYRHDGRAGGGGGSGGPSDSGGFALTKVERGRLGCGGAGENWQVIWEK
jgi:hypothetical protein